MALHKLKLLAEKKEEKNEKHSLKNIFSVYENKIEKLQGKVQTKQSTKKQMIIMK